MGIGAAVLVGGVLWSSGILTRDSTPEAVTQASAPTLAAGQMETPAIETPIFPTESPAPSETPQLSPSPIPDTAEISGGIAFRDDRFVVGLEGIDDPPEGQAYFAWLTGSNEEQGEVLLNLGAVDLANGVLIIDYTSPEPTNLFATFSTFLLTSNPAQGEVEGPGEEFFQVQIDPELSSRLRLLHEVQRGDPIAANLLEWLRRQTQHFTDHANNTFNSIQSDNLSTTKAHAEHTINIIEGRQGELYADWDNNGRVENPGDDVGLLNYLHVLESFAQSSAHAEGESRDLALSIAEGAANLLDQVIEAREIARQIVLADTIDLIVELELDQDIAQATGLKEQIESLAGRAEALDLTLYLPIGSENR
jgi:hypothetical protein